MDAHAQSPSLVREARLSRGWTLKDLARRLRITRMGVWLIEKRGSTKAATALKLARILEVAPEILFPNLFPTGQFFRADALPTAPPPKMRPPRRTRGTSKGRAR